MKVLILDHGSEYLEDLIKLLKRKRVGIDIKKPRENFSAFDCVIASGGVLPRKGHHEILRWYKVFLSKLKKPFLGICLGHKILGYCYGAKILKIHERGIVKIKFHEEYPLASGVKEMTVYEDHDYGLFKLPKKLKNYASSDKCKIQALKVAGKNQYSVQFHPEVKGESIINNFVEVCGSITRKTLFHFTIKNREAHLLNKEGLN